MELKPVAYLINNREHCTGIHSVQSMKDVGLTEKVMQDRWGDALIPLYAIPEGYSITKDKPKGYWHIAGSGMSDDEVEEMNASVAETMRKHSKPRGEDA